jgi:uncharacterized membrane protein YfcA
LVLDLPQAIALVLVPSFATNLWQAVVGSNGRVILRRLWPFFLVATVTVWLGATALTRIDLSLLSALLGALLAVYSTANLASLRLTVSPRLEVWVGLLMGSANGILAGMTGSFVVPGVWFLQAIGLQRDVLIQAMGMLFTASTLALAFALQGHGLLTIELGTLSAAALLPALFGMVLGRRIRQMLPEQIFQRVFFIFLLMLGAYLIASAFGSFK